MSNNVHPNALVEDGVTIGKGTHIWAFVHVISGAVIGADCNICDHTFVEGQVVLGDRVTVKCGVYLWNGVTVEDDVFIGPAVVFTNDLRPRSKNKEFELTLTTLKRGSSLGANSTILAGTSIGEWSLVGAGSVVTKDVPDFAVVWGNPAEFRYWICKCTARIDFDGSTYTCKCGEAYRLESGLVRAN